MAQSLSGDSSRSSGGTSQGPLPSKGHEGRGGTRLGRLLQPTKTLCDCCCKVHTDKDIDGKLFELCLICQAELTAFTFEQAF